MVNYQGIAWIYDGQTVKGTLLKGDKTHNIFQTEALTNGCSSYFVV